VSVTVSPVRDAAGRVVGASAIARDITAKRLAADALRQSEARKAAILQTALDAMITIDQRGHVVEFNPAAEKMFGYRGPEAVGRPLAELIIPPELRERHARGLAHYLETGEGRLLDRRIELVALRADGTRFPVELAITRISPDDPPFFTGAIRDISERKRSEAALKEAARRKDEFLAVLSHELRNPLAPIRSALEIMRIQPPAEPQVRDARDVIERQLTHLVRLVDDLLDISRITRGRIELRTERVELTTVLKSALESARQAIESAGHELVVTLPDRAVMLDVDPVRMAQALLNLLNNAAKFTPKGGRIELAADSQDGDAVIVVRDSGVGIPADALDGIFEIFAQGPHSAELAHSGLGVGLALARTLVELHGGSLVARSAGPGQGSEFIVRLPQAQGSAPERRAAALTDEGAPAAPKPPVAPRRILVVDDNVDQAKSLGVLLQLAGHDVRIAYDAAGAIATLESFTPEVALLDIGLPGQNGYQLARRLRATPALREMLLIAQTGWGTEEDRMRSREAGFDHHLAQPIDLGTLEGLLRRGRRLEPHLDP
jgi:PAS domain S-box-containing protein